MIQSDLYEDLDAIIYARNWAESRRLYKPCTDINNKFLQDLKKCKDTMYQFISEKNTEELIEVVLPELPKREMEWEELFLYNHLMKLLKLLNRV